MSASGWTVGSSNDALVSSLVHSGTVEREDVERVMRMLDRKDFARAVNFPQRTPTDADAYRDAPLQISAKATISAPHMHARALELLAPVIVGTPKARVLDVGHGSGYLTAAFALLGGEGTHIYGIENEPRFVELAETNVRRARRALLDEGRVSFFECDGWAGLPEHAPFNAIHVGAAAASVPLALVAQLAPGGCMVVPIGEQYETQDLVRVDKSADGSVVATPLYRVRYVPLVEPDY